MSQYGTVSSTAAAQPAYARPKVRFETLDSWRGICALLVAMMHFPAAGWLGENAIVRNGYLFVDYFFVLSGVVIAHGYADRIADFPGFRRFMLLRWGRVYPLHVAVLLLFVAFEATRMLVPALGGGQAPFTGDNSIAGLLSSLLLLNGTGLESSLVWNGPSWSISSEFWTYILFGGAVLVLGSRVWIALVAAVFLGPLVLAANSTELMDTTWQLGLVRCVYGFALGALIYMVMRDRLSSALYPQQPESPATGHPLVRARRATRRDPIDWNWTVLELTAVIVVGLFVGVAGRTALSFAAPFVFGLALVVFMHERGLVSRLLRMRFFLFLGTLSYGIYMLHIFVQSRIINAGTLAGKVFGTDFVGSFQMAGQQFYGFGINGALFGTVMMIAMLAVVIFAAWLGNILIEKPFQRWTRRAADRMSTSRSDASGKLAVAA